MKYIQIIIGTFLILLHNHNSMFPFFPLRSWMAGVPWSIHFPPPLFPNWFGSQWLPEPGAAPGLSWHHVITSHDMSSSFTPTLITITIPLWPIMLTPAVWTFEQAKRFRVQENFYLNILLILITYCFMQSCSVFIWPLGPCWVWFVRGAELLIQSFLFECQINFMNHKTCPDCSLMMSHYTLALCVNCWVRDKILALFTPPPIQDRYLFSFDMFILIIQFPSGFYSLLCHVGNQLTQLSHYPRTQHYTSYSLRRLFMMAVHENK